MVEDNKPAKEPEEKREIPDSGYPYPSYYYPPPTKPTKEPISIKLIVGIIVLIIVVVFVFLMAISYLLFSEVPTDDQTYEFDVIIDSGGHYRYTLDEYYYYDDTEVELDIYSTNGSFYDVYVMNQDQYDSAYGNGGNSTKAFAAMYSKENVKQVSDKFDLPSNAQGPIYLIIDNKATELTKNDADPAGEISVTAKITITTEYAPIW